MPSLSPLSARMQQPRTVLTPSTTRGSDTVTLVGMLRGMGRAWGSGGRLQRRPVSDEERAEAVERYRESVGHLQRSAFRNLRNSIANAAIFFAGLSAFMILTGDVTPATLLPMAVSVVGGALGVGSYVVRQEPLSKYLLIAAVVLAVAGLTGAIIASQAAS